MADNEEECRRNSKGSKHSRKTRKRSRSPESSEDLGTSSTSSRSISPERKKSKKSKKKRSKKSSSSKSSSSECSGSELEDMKKQHNKKAKRREQRQKREKKSKKRKEKSKQKGKKSSLVVNQQKYGKYGILMESDMFNKQQEFYLWLQEVKQVNPEVIPRFEMKKMFDSYAEDYNTVTLPHKKFYDLEKWETKQREKGRMKAIKKAHKQQVSIESDEIQHKRLHSGPARHEMSRQDLLEMQRIMRERQQEDYKKKSGMQIDETKGVRYHTILP
ncbi:hypothetical protein P5673_025618 [Acropora cervicornis]|uniref:Uncharacterized protein n=1 Tax=Acropora cervicornis TaxID=6130 RepID=A0AAD9Q2H5_ACRCE|nr:hypothetical protein P5673_025618 [Acropora cervicornis]